MRVVVIGAGVVGASVAAEMSALGCTDVTVLDQGPLFATGGSSSHAPGLVFQANPSKAMTELATYTVEKFGELAFDGRPGFERVGGLEVATTPHRLADLHRRHGWLTSWGVPSRVVSAQECSKLHPLLDAEQILGGLHTPTDGLANPVVAVSAQAAAAGSTGVRSVYDANSALLEEREIPTPDACAAPIGRRSSAPRRRPRERVASEMSPSA